MSVPPRLHAAIGPLALNGPAPATPNSLAPPGLPETGLAQAAATGLAVDEVVANNTLGGDAWVGTAAGAARPAWAPRGS
jgi:hypothetical protein